MSHVHVQAIYTFTLLIPLIPRQYAEPTKMFEKDWRKFRTGKQLNNKVIYLIIKLNSFEFCIYSGKF